MHAIFRVVPVLLLSPLIAACSGDDAEYESPDAGPRPDAIAAFSEPTRLDSLPIMALNLFVRYIDLESSPSGNMVALWTEQIVDGNTGSATDAVVSSVRTDGGTWRRPGGTLGPMGSHAGDFSADDEGNALVPLADPTAVSVTGYDPSTKLWGAPQTLATTKSQNGATVMKPDGDGYAFWVQGDGDLWLEPYTRAAGWGAPELLLAVSDGFTVDLHVGVADSGAALVVYQVDALLDAPQRTDLRAVWYTPGVGASDPEELLSLPFGDGLITRKQSVHVFPDGRAIVAFTHPPQFKVAGPLLARRFEPGTGWIAPETLSDPDAVTGYPTIAADQHGNAIVGFAQKSAGATSFEPRVNRFEPATGWSGSTPIVRNFRGNSAGVVVALDENGQALAAYANGDDIEYAAYTRAAGWSGVRSISGVRPDFSNLRLAPWGEGRFTLAWVTVRGLAYAADWPGR